MTTTSKKWLWFFATILLFLLIILFAIRLGTRNFLDFYSRPSLETVTSSSLQSIREENRLTVFMARYVAVSTSSEQHFGFSARKTLIMPGNVRYEVNLAALSPHDLKWDNDRHLLTVSLPPIEISQPEVDMASLREYDSGGMLMALTDAEQQLDSANRKAAIEDLSRQARNNLSMKLANEAACRAVERAFLMPLKSAGLTANVEVRFRS
ncbi:MAG: DUF4230 domain-containing protein [Zymomonas mobilis]|uniref:Uncharacterized protein DUF4230 n=1 Tax=Zymomonas mobilis TaxID=542 RepID=A0A542VYS6_ZYMMB|nr:DUF4230 domain-containing protein [Zymomonas mobilis]TQL16486.1 uncharacterized protein DUF4230 [Zymomonas mobilis]